MVSDNKNDVDNEKETTIAQFDESSINDHPMESAAVDDEDYEDKTVHQVITKRDLWKCAWRGQFMEANFNFERYQGGGFAFSIIPALKKIHGNNKGDLAKSLTNHIQFFNASPKLFTFLLGTAIAMEENKESPNTINAMKVAGMGPTGGIGDAIDHMTLMPLTLALGASISLSGSIAGPFVFFILYQLIYRFIYFGLMFLGYKAGTAAMINMSGATEKLARAANIMGIFVIGALSATFIHFETVVDLSLGGKAISIQHDLFDKIMPNLLVLALVFFMFKMVKGTGFWAKPPVLIFATLIVGILGHYAGIL